MYATKIINGIAYIFFTKHSSHKFVCDSAARRLFG